MKPQTFNVEGPNFEEEDGDRVLSAIVYLVQNSAVPRMDLKLEDNKTAKVYWAGAVLRIDIEGLR